MDESLNAISERMNQVASDTQQELDAEAVVVMTLVRKPDGLELAIGSTGSEIAILVLVEHMPLIADALREVAATHQSAFNLDVDHHAN